MQVIGEKTYYHAIHFYLVFLNICVCVLGRNKCVKLMREQPRSWIDSQKLCGSEEGAELISIDSQEEQRAMEDIVFNR